MDTQATKSSVLMVKLKESWADKCTSEKDSANDTLTTKFTEEKEKLQTDLTKKHQEDMKTATDNLKSRCDNEKAEFK
jgi:hypothetical protein